MDNHNKKGIIKKATIWREQLTLKPVYINKPNVNNLYFSR
jgi:hypothetical protein